MKRRRFLTMAGAAAAGMAGVAGARGARSRPPEPPPLEAVAAAPPDGSRLGVQRVVWSVETAEPVVALTFDDGPDPELTPRVLEVLDRYQIPATFFVMGYNAAQRPDLLVEVASRGHEIGNHTWAHLDLTRQTPEVVRRELVACRQYVEAAIGVPPRHFRPPRGMLSGVASRHLAELGDDIVLWSLGRGVPGTGTARQVADHIDGNVVPGDIVVLHDGIGREGMRVDLTEPGPVERRRLVELAALDEIVDRILAKGLRPVRVSELLAGAT